jgi:hypothetical protein
MLVIPATQEAEVGRRTKSPVGRRFGLCLCLGSPDVNPETRTSASSYIIRKKVPREVRREGKTDNQEMSLSDSPLWAAEAPSLKGTLGAPRYM